MYYLAGRLNPTSFDIMSSPDNIPYRSIIQIDKSNSQHVYLQIAQQFIQAIVRGHLRPGAKLLGTRQLSELLDVHRNTITAGYEELFAQGWVEIIANKGTFISSELPLLNPSTEREYSYPKTTGYRFRKSFLLDNPFEKNNYELSFNDGTPDIRLTQLDDLSRIYSANLKRKVNRRKMGYYNHDGSEYFKEQLTMYLQHSRGLAISKDNLLITRSMEMSLFIIAEIILEPSDTVVVAELGYFSANMIFQKAGNRIKTIPVDEDGIDTNALRKLCEQEPIRMVYVTPQQHYPTTVPLSAQRRMDLLQLANQYGFIIVEDDYDYDFHYEKQPILPLASNDQNGMVIYVGSFGKSLAPGFRTGFIVAPRNIMQEMRKHLGIIDRQGDILMEQALGELIQEGVVDRHLKKSIKVYKERRDHFGYLLSEHLGERVQFTTPKGGLAFWLNWRKAINLYELAKRCAAKHLFLPKTLLYQSSKTTGTRIGFGNLDMEEMEQAVKILKLVLEEMES